MKNYIYDINREETKTSTLLSGKIFTKSDDELIKLI